MLYKQIYIYKNVSNKLIYLDRKTAHKTSITDIYYSKEKGLVYSSGEDGSFTATPIKETIDKKNTAGAMFIQFGQENYINSIGYTASKNKNYIITIDKNGRMIYWDFDINNLFGQIRKLLKSNVKGKIEEIAIPVDNLNNNIQNINYEYEEETVEEVKVNEAPAAEVVGPTNKGKYILVVQVFSSKENTLQYINKSSDNLNYHQVGSRYYIYVHRSSNREDVVQYKTVYKNDSWIKTL